MSSRRRSTEYCSDPREDSGEEIVPEGALGVHQVRRDRKGDSDAGRLGESGMSSERSGSIPRGPGFAEFRDKVNASQRDMCRQVFFENRNSIRVKKEETAVRNLSRIFESALRISNEKGFQAMTMRDLGKEAGLSMGALYAYFSGKEELLEMLQRQGRTLILTVLDEFVANETDPLSRLRVAIRTHVYLSEIMQPWFFFSYMEAKNLCKEERDKAIASELATERIVADILIRGQEEGFFVARNHRLTASVIKAMLQDWYLKRWKYAKRRVTPDQYAQFLIEFVETFCVDRDTSPNTTMEHGDEYGNGG